MGIRETLEAHDARFISLAELLEAVAEAEGVTVQETARAFSVGVFMSKVKHRLRNFVDGSYAECNGGAAYYELEKVISPESINCMYDQAQNDYAQGEPGFFRDEVAVPLAQCAFAVPKLITSKIPAAAETNAESDRLCVDLEHERKRCAALEAELESLRNQCEVAPVGQDREKIKGPTSEKLDKIIAAFTTVYGGRKMQGLKLDNDIRQWIRNEFGCSHRECHVFGKFVAEHFGLR